MKRVFNWGGLLAAALATVFTGCTKENISEPSGAEQNKIIISANALTPASVDSKTVVGDRTDAGTYPVYWSETGEAIDVIEVVDNLAPEAKDFIQSSAYTLSDDKKNATFEIALTENTTGTAFDYYACYPSSVCTGIYADYKDATVKLPSAQTPTATSADPAASILFASDTGYDAQPSSLNFQFRHVAAYAKMTISNLPVASDEVIQSVTFSAPDNTLAGTYWYYYEEPESSKPSDNGTKLTAITANVASVVDPGSTDFTVWFACLPATVSTKFQVSVATDKQSLIRDVEISGNDLTFITGQVSTFTVDMSSSAQGSDLSGEYVVLAEKNGIYYALASTANNSDSHLDAVTFEYNGTDEKVAADNPATVWTVTKSGSSYTFENGGKYIFWPGGEDNAGNKAEMSDSEYALAISDNGDGTYKITSVAQPDRELQKNNQSAFFAFYKGTQTGNLRLIPVAAVPRITFEENAVSLEYNDVASHELNVTVDNAVSVVAGAYADAEGSAECDWLTATYTDGKVTYSATENDTDRPRTAYIVVSATNDEGTKKASAAVTQGVNPSVGPVSTTVSMDTFSATSGSVGEDLNVAYSCAQGGGTTPPAINNGQIRLYQNNSGTAGGNITITAKSGYKIQSVTIGSDMSTSIKYEIDGSGEHLPSSAISLAAGGTYELSNQNATSVTFHCYGNDKKTRLYVNYLSVTYVTE